MARREEPVYTLGAVPQAGSTWQIQRGADAILNLHIDLPPPLTTGMLFSDSTITAGYMHIREAKADATPKVIAGTTGGRLYMTLTRTSATRVDIEIHLPDTVTETALDLMAIQDTPTRRRYEVPGKGFMDVLLEADGEFHYVFECAVEARRMVTRIADE